jgi:hypothetical protein
MLADLLRTAKANGGFLANSQLRDLAHADPQRLVLIRCNRGRCLVPAGEAIAAIERIGGDAQDWVRDVSLPISDPIYATEYPEAQGKPYHRRHTLDGYIAEKESLDAHRRNVARYSEMHKYRGGIASDADPGSCS